MAETYYTIAARATHEEKIQRSVFIGHAAPVATEEEARDFIAQIRQEHATATHNCYAYSLGAVDEPLLYYNDHGEPPGTAGRPILNAIRKTGLTNTVVVVTRYFGGKTRGTGVDRRLPLGGPAGPGQGGQGTDRPRLHPGFKL